MRLVSSTRQIGGGTSPVAAPSRPQEHSLPHWDDLSGIEDVLRIECLLDRAHGVDGLLAKFSLEVFLLALPDAMLAGAGAVHRLRPLHQPMHEFLAAGHLVGIIDIA